MTLKHSFECQFFKLFIKGLKGAFVKAYRTKDKSNEGILLLAIGVSLKACCEPFKIQTFAHFLAKVSQMIPMASS